MFLLRIILIVTFFLITIYLFIFELASSSFSSHTDTDITNQTKSKSILVSSIILFAYSLFLLFIYTKLSEKRISFQINNHFVNSLLSSTNPPSSIKKINKIINKCLLLNTESNYIKDIIKINKGKQRIKDYINLYNRININQTYINSYVENYNLSSKRNNNSEVLNILKTYSTDINNESSSFLYYLLLLNKFSNADEENLFHTESPDLKKASQQNCTRKSYINLYIKEFPCKETYFIKNYDDPLFTTQSSSSNMKICVYLNNINKDSQEFENLLLFIFSQFECDDGPNRRYMIRRLTGKLIEYYEVFEKIRTSIGKDLLDNTNIGISSIELLNSYKYKNSLVINDLNTLIHEDLDKSFGKCDVLSHKIYELNLKVEEKSTDLGISLVYMLCIIVLIILISLLGLFYVVLQMMCKESRRESIHENKVNEIIFEEKVNKNDNINNENEKIEDVYSNIMDDNLKKEILYKDKDEKNDEIVYKI